MKPSILSLRALQALGRLPGPSSLNPQGPGWAEFGKNCGVRWGGGRREEFFFISGFSWIFLNELEPLWTLFRARFTKA